MCGIIGYVGGESATPILLAGLKRLEYRGYDSAGIAIQHNGELKIRRSVGKLTNLETVLQNGSVVGRTGIGHTRWATHGRPSEQNAHPHRSGDVVLVHNGIIENFLVLRHRLESEGYRFESETDTEVIAHLISSTMKKEHSLHEAVRLIAHELHGSYAIAVMSLAEPGRIVVSRSGCPLVIGRNEKGAFLASDVTPLLAHTRDVVFLEDGDVGILEESGITILDPDGKPKHVKAVTIDWDAEAAEKGGYPDFMIKEIHEQPQVIMDTLRGRFNYESGEADLPDLAMTNEELLNARRIWIVACGTSWHSGLVGKYLFEEMIRKPVQVDIGSEFRYREPMIQKDDLFIVISQSGETADTLAAAREAKRRGARVLAIVNALGSTLAREADGVIYTRCGPEISVASTKAFTGQVIALYLLALHVGRVRRTLSPEEGRWWLDHFLMLPGQVEHILKQEAAIQKIASRYYQKRNFLYLGRGINYPIALEGALKLKEISYIHAEGYPAGEMKHGPIALIDEDMPVVVLSPKDRLYEKSVSNLMEVRARNAPVIAFVSEGDHELEQVADHVFAIPDVHPLLTPILFTVGLQLLAYHIAVLREVDVDRPRNLAKSVTVE
ncbi:MAG: glutamine--fructose-6-phosphate transaminase (isomerizing) [Nitrospirota bacterium]|jgi:glucosamine--fructose-6-phosphate aminotransferase (isomerizing)|nr:glutamine--fructose-6-phosphate transaminase (isomerizing) [Nitrospirota bacterium]MDH5574676.1 glutamine--fructose-6-phosphate transaminase (isomerizing) [Nitrospirota bacterium]